MFAAWLGSSALAQQKTVKECEAEWTANKAAIQASGKTKKDFVAECRAGGTTAATPAPAPAATPAAGTQKTVKECEAEWTANKAAIQASGKTKKDFVAECRAGGTTAAAPAAPTPAPAPTQARAAATPATGTPSGAGEFATEDLAKAHCPSDTVVWANLQSKIYHFDGSKYYGKTKSGAYICEKDATATGFRAAQNEKHP
jgi:hypothetical protein